MMLALMRIAAIIVGLIIIYLTLGPVDVRSMNPVAGPSDRALAYAVIGALAVFSAPRRPWLAALLVVFMAVGLEAAQRFTLDRHGHLVDVIEKLVGAGIGIGAACAIRLILRVGAGLMAGRDHRPTSRFVNKIDS